MNQSKDHEFDALIARTSPEDFDGHTEFENFSAEERLAWLSQLARFVYEMKGTACNRG